jgi:hypothetical protein
MEQHYVSFFIRFRVLVLSLKDHARLCASASERVINFFALVGFELLLIFIN